LKNIARLLRKDYIRFFNDKPALILTFLVPILLILIFGNIFGSGGSRGKINVILVNQSQSEIASLIESKLDSSSSLRIVKSYTDENTGNEINFDEETARKFITDGRISAAVIIPEDFMSDTSTSLNFRFLYDPKNEIESSIIQGSIQREIMTTIPNIFPLLMQRRADTIIGSEQGEKFNDELSEVISKYFDIEADTIRKYTTDLDENFVTDSATDSSEGNFIENLVSFESEQLVGTEVANPGVTRTVGGWAVMFLLFSITGAATSLFEEQQEGSLKRLLCMPVKRSQILWSKYLFSISLGMVQLFSMFIFAYFVFEVDIFSNFFNLFIVILASSAAAVSFGMLITSFARSISQANGIATLLILVMSALGGSWFPVFLLPDWMQIVSKITITYWAVEGFLQVLWRNSDFDGIVLNVLILFSMAFIVNFYSLIRIKRSSLL
jgi:ABC-2 type transport system permease protein